MEAKKNRYHEVNRANLINPIGNGVFLGIKDYGINRHTTGTHDWHNRHNLFNFSFQIPVSLAD